MIIVIIIIVLTLGVPTLKTWYAVTNVHVYSKQIGYLKKSSAVSPVFIDFFVYYVICVAFILW